MSIKIGHNLTTNYSINFNLPKRTKYLIKFIIIHYTGMRKESRALQRLLDIKSKVSSHYFIKSNGKVLNLVPDLYEAWHAGKSSWQNFKFLNKYSIGIELHNPGHEFGYKNFHNKQIKSLIKLLKKLKKKYSIKSKFILGHSDIAPDRKKDPGEKFPWKKLGKENLCQWYNLTETKNKQFSDILINNRDKIRFFKNLKKIGYNCKNKVFLIKAFQRKYRQSLINGKFDRECLLISKSLIKQ